MSFRFLIILDDADIARYVCQHEGICPFVDLEVLGKDARQGHLRTWKSKQTISDVTVIREAVPDAHLVVRINPFHDGTAGEIEEVISRGADSIMLPMFSDRDTLARFLDLLRERTRALPLFETEAAVRGIPDMIETLDLKQIHIGLNDLHLDMGCDFLFEPLADGILEEPAAAMRACGVAFGIGGLARAGEGKVSPEYLMGEHVRLGSDGAILSQTFHRNPRSLDELKDSMDFAAELKRLKRIYDVFQSSGEDDLRKNAGATQEIIRSVAQQIRDRRLVL